MSRSHADAIAIAVERAGSFPSVERLWRASGVSVAALRRLAAADAFASMNMGRQQALWQVRRLHDEVLPLFDQAGEEHEQVATLPAVSVARAIQHDYNTVGLSLKAHPISLVRDRLDELHVSPCRRMRSQDECSDGIRLSVAGLVLVRQRPGTASGVVFMTIEDETGIANLILWPKVFDRFRRVARHSQSVICWGKVQREGEVVHLIVSRIADLSELITGTTASRVKSRDFH